jgi:epoxide hydrolase 4
MDVGMEARIAPVTRSGSTQATTAYPCLPETLGFGTAWFDLPGLRVHAAVAGPEAGPLVVLLHGFPEFWYSWRHQIGPLAQAGFRVVAPDLRGYNQTGKAPPYDISTLTTDVAHLIRACGRERSMVAGHDWGAMLAWALAGLHPALVERFAILNVPQPAVMARALAGGDPRQMLRSWYILFFQLPRLPEWLLSRSGFRALRRMLVATSRPGTFGPVDLTRYRDAWSRPGALPAMLGWYRTGYGPNRERLRRVAFRRLRSPGLILWGDRDVALRPELAQQSLAWLEHGRLVRFPEATHWVHQESPDEINHHLLEFFLTPL